MTARLAEIGRFLVGGVSTTAVSYALYLLLLQWMPYGAAYAIGYVAGIVWSYSIGAWFVFRVPWRWRGLLQFPLVYVVQFAFGVAVVWVAVEWLHLRAEFAPLLAIVASLPLTYVLSRRLIKRPFGASRDSHP